MSAHAATSPLPQYQLTSDLNRQCLPAAEKDPERKVAWMNAICALVLAVGLLMTEKPAEIAFQPDIYEPPQTIELPQIQPETKLDMQEIIPDDAIEIQETAPVAVIVVAPDTAKVPFAVPVVGATLVSTDLRQVSAPPRLVLPPPKVDPPKVFQLRFGQSEKGNFPPPTTYPQEAIARKEQGVVWLEMKASDEGGEPLEVRVKESSGSSYLDFEARDWVRRKWRFNRGYAGTYVVPFDYKLPGTSK